MLRCGRCASEWPAARLACYACGDPAPGGLVGWFVEGQESRRRLVRCRACGATLLVVATLGRLAPPALLVAELEAIPLRLKVALDPGATAGPST